jgi:hypothetical protein
VASWVTFGGGFDDKEGGPTIPAFEVRESDVVDGDAGGCNIDISRRL